MADSRVKHVIAIEERSRDTIFVMAASKGGFPLRYREHALSLARRKIEKLKAADWTEQEIGAAWGLSQSMVNDLKNGKMSKLGVRALLALRRGLGLSLDDLLGLPPLGGNVADDEHEPSSRRPQ